MIYIIYFYFVKAFFYETGGILTDSKSVSHKKRLLNSIRIGVKPILVELVAFMQLATIVETIFRKGLSNNF